MLRAVDVCHKLETVQEKVLPFYTSSSKKKEKAHALEAMSEELEQVKYSFSQILHTLLSHHIITHSLMSKTQQAYQFKQWSVNSMEH